MVTSGRPPSTAAPAPRSTVLSPLVSVARLGACCVKRPSLLAQGVVVPNVFPFIPFRKILTSTSLLTFRLLRSDEKDVVAYEEQALWYRVHERGVSNLHVLDPRLILRPQGSTKQGTADEARHARGNHAHGLHLLLVDAVGRQADPDQQMHRSVAIDSHHRGGVAELTKDGETVLHSKNKARNTKQVRLGHVVVVDVPLQVKENQ